MNSINYKNYRLFPRENSNGFYVYAEYQTDESFQFNTGYRKTPELAFEAAKKEIDVILNDFLTDNQ